MKKPNRNSVSNSPQGKSGADSPKKPPFIVVWTGASDLPFNASARDIVRKRIIDPERGLVFEGVIT